MNVFAVDTAVASQDGYVPPPAEALAWLRAENFMVEDLGRIRVSGQDVPVVRVTSNTGDPLACGPKATSADGTCFFTGTPGAVYGFVRVGERTIVVEARLLGRAGGLGAAVEHPRPLIALAARTFLAPTAQDALMTSALRLTKVRTADARPNRDQTPSRTRQACAIHSCRRGRTHDKS